MDINIEQVAFIGILFVALVAVWALVRANVTIANLIPVPLVQELIRAAVNTALDIAEQRAATTPEVADDEFVKMIRDEVAKVLGTAQLVSSTVITPAKADVNAAVDARIDADKAQG
jgi:uncharacterized membrane protein